MSRVDGFRPARWLPGPHLQTILPALLPGPRSRRHDAMVVDVGGGSAVRLDIDRPVGRSAATMLLVHGMCGSSESSHVLRTAEIARLHGWTTVRMNLRTCGGTESLSRSLYNAGQSEDVAAVLRRLDAESFPRPFVAAGFSLGGNIVLRYAALAGDRSEADAVAAVNPPVDLACCARAIELPANRLYREYYVRRLCAQLERFLRARRPDAATPRPRAVATLRRFDELYTAPDAGYSSADEYYATASSGPRLTGIRRPALVLSSADDPFVPVEMFEPYHGLERLEFVHPPGGGHCGYWRSDRPRYWAGVRVVEFLRDSCA